MPIKINGTNTAANPSITGDDTDTGIVYGSDQIDFSTGGSSKVTLNGSNLGIGTQSPSELVHINGGNLKIQQPAGTEAKIVINEATTTNCLNSKQTATEALIQSTASQPFNIRSQSGAGSTGHLAFWTRNNERMRIDSSGSVQIATTTSYGRVHSVEKSFHPDNSNWLTGASYVASGSFGGAYALLDGSKGYSMFCAGNGDDFFIRHHSSTTAGATGGVVLDNGATAFTGASDERDKENLVDLTNGITKIKALRTVIGNYIWQPDEKHAFFIAQDVQNVLPEAVSVINKDAETEDQRLGIRYTEVMPLITKALQEAIAKIETLETKVAALEAK